MRFIRFIRSINRLACRLSSHRFQHSDRRVGDRTFAVDCCSRCGWQVVRRAYEGKGEAGSVPEPACESGQAFVGQVLVMAPIAIPVAIGFTVLILTG